MADDLYKEHILDHAQNPRNFGPPTLALRKGEMILRVREANSSCGDLIEMYVTVKDKKEVVDVRFKGVGCAISTAAASLLTEAMKNEKWRIGNAKKFTDEDMVEMMGIEISPTRMKCVLLPLRALKKALAENEKLKIDPPAPEALEGHGNG